jgi:hypothetical protein
MPFYKFNRNDVIKNVVRAYPYNEFYIYNGQVYYNNTPLIQGNFQTRHLHVDTGYISLHEINVDQPSSLIYPFIVKGGSLDAFKTVSVVGFNKDFNYGDEMQGTYPLSASITRKHFSEGQVRQEVNALKNTLDFYTQHSIHYSSSYTGDDTIGDWHKETQELSYISIPSIFYGSSIKKGSLKLNFYVSGSLIGTLEDEKQNGELIQTGPTGSNESGSVAGVVLYNEGFVILTGSWDITEGGHTEGGGYESATAAFPTWINFGAGANDGKMQAAAQTGSSFQMSFRGVTETPTITMMAHAPLGELNYSNNSTFVQYGQSTGSTSGKTAYHENKNRKLYNVVSGAYSDSIPDFDHQTYISKIGIYDKYRNLIAIAKLATPVKKTQQRNLTFKLKLDI